MARAARVFMGGSSSVSGEFRVRSQVPQNLRIASSFRCPDRMRTARLRIGHLMPPNGVARVASTPGMRYLQKMETCAATPPV